MPIAVGLLIGVLGVLWVDPKTTGGAIILIAVGVLVAAIGRLIFSLGKTQ